MTDEYGAQWNEDYKEILSQGEFVGHDTTWDALGLNPGLGSKQIHH
jgi:hypothetical protein